MEGISINWDLFRLALFGLFMPLFLHFCVKGFMSNKSSRLANVLLWIVGVLFVLSILDLVFLISMYGAPLMASYIVAGGGLFVILFYVLMFLIVMFSLIIFVVFFLGHLF